ncbi:MAG: DUF3343 domain-containing protein [Clostridiales bacterium]|nr:DUF3343 domain-containing protein [Clostridiales bacterium]
MTETLAIFRSRSQAIDCMNKLRALNIPAQLINTPKEANVGCGLSLRFSVASATRAKSVIAKMRYSSFYGYMRMDFKGGKFYIKGF